MRRRKWRGLIDSKLKEKEIKKGKKPIAPKSKRGKWVQGEGAD